MMMADSTLKIVVTFARASLFALFLTRIAWATQDVQNISKDNPSALSQKAHTSDLKENESEVAELRSSSLVHEKATPEENRALFGRDMFDLLRDSVKHVHHKKRHGKHSRTQRKKRHLTQSRHHEGRPRKSCKTKSAFVYHTEATDIFGNTVTLHPSIHVGGVAVDQYFYETFCDKEACACSGIDEDNYRSACETTHSFTYARVIKQGEIGWTQIMIRSGCTCVIHTRKPRRRLINIMDAI